MIPILFDSYENCTGCGSCLQKCPVSAIEMYKSDYDFIFPRIDSSKCIGCGSCVRTCPIHNRNSSFINNSAEPVLYACRHKDKEILKNSSSGGAFTALVQTLQPDYVFGVAFDESFNAAHICVKSSQIGVLRGSKYVQSNTKLTFLETRKLLNDGKKILYTGTPCQIAGLKMFLEKNYDNLFTCDLICEGVPSQSFFSNYLKDLSFRKKKRIINVEFRKKNSGGWERSDFVVKFSSGASCRTQCHTRDSFFTGGMMYLGACRDSCYHCKFNRLPRQGDFSIGDLWGWKEIVPEWDDNMGISVLLINSERAQLSALNFDSVLDMKKITIEQASRHNPNIVAATKPPSIRTSFLEDYKNLTFDQLKAKYHKPRSKLRRFLSSLKFKLFR